MRTRQKQRCATFLSETLQTLVDVSDFFFFLLGKGEGGVRGAGTGGWSVFIENPRRGVLQEGEGLRGRRVSAANWGMGVGEG